MLSSMWSTCNPSKWNCYKYFVFNFREALNINLLFRTSFAPFPFPLWLIQTTKLSSGLSSGPLSPPLTYGPWSRLTENQDYEEVNFYLPALPYSFSPFFRGRGSLLTLEDQSPPFLSAILTHFPRGFSLSTDPLGIDLPYSFFFSSSPFSFLLSLFLFTYCKYSSYVMSFMDMAASTTYNVRLTPKPVTWIPASLLFSKPNL